jgi:hypothetical protein
MKYNNLEEWARWDVWKPFLNRANTIGGPEQGDLGVNFS